MLTESVGSICLLSQFQILTLALLLCFFIKTKTSWNISNIPRYYQLSYSQITPKENTKTVRILLLYRATNIITKLVLSFLS